MPYAMSMDAPLQAYLVQATERLKGALDLEALYLFGSHARGTADRRSDLDLLVVARTSLPPLARLELVLNLLADAPLPVEALVLTPEELAERSDLPFLKGVLREAIPLYERGKAA
ncbi:nucleotidyltransferase (plasmid) [Thermus brockianus]|uniref:Nucleotidyltransferase n=2 Tax=Thermaceae TaxID=188786 RepID=A0A1J0LYA6_THEBO|nr:nucleotidyltransferase [Thermus brockianus]